MVAVGIASAIEGERVNVDRASLPDEKLELSGPCGVVPWFLPVIIETEFAHVICTALRAYKDAQGRLQINQPPTMPPRRNAKGKSKS